MADPLLDLEDVVLFKREKLTAEEANFIQTWKTKALGDFFTTSLAGGAATWAATWKLKKSSRVQLSAALGLTLGQWILRRSVYSSVDQILSMDGSILQKELANILVTKYQNNSDLTLKHLISKHFYSERIFDDSNPNTAKLRWRYRNFFSDNAVHGQRAHDNDKDNDSDSNAKTQDNSPNVSHNDSRGYSKNVNDSESPNLEARRIFTKAVPVTMTELDPLDSLFDDDSPQEEIHHPNSPNKPSGTHNRSHKRSHRRRRMRNHEDLLNAEHAAAV